MLVAELEKAYNSYGNGLRMTNIHLYGIKFANELKGIDLVELSVRATDKKSFSTEIRKGMKLAEFVTLK